MSEESLTPCLNDAKAVPRLVENCEDMEEQVNTALGK